MTQTTREKKPRFNPTIAYVWYAEDGGEVIHIDMRAGFRLHNNTTFKIKKIKVRLTPI